MAGVGLLEIILQYCLYVLSSSKESVVELWGKKTEKLEMVEEDFQHRKVADITNHTDY